MSGTTSLSLQQQFDRFGQLLIGGLVYTFQAGTLTPQSAFRDASLSTAWPNPLNLDASGRVPSLWFADGVIRIRITDISGVVQFDGDALPVLGSSAAATPTAPTDPNAVYSFGDFKVRYGVGPLTGYVRANGNSISKGGAGGTERANDDTIQLYTYLYGLNDADLTVPGRTGNVANDFSSGLTLTLPDFRGCLIGALDDMGASASGRLNATNWAALVAASAGLAVPLRGSKNPTTLGGFNGLDNMLIAKGELPSFNLDLSNFSVISTLGGSGSGAPIAPVTGVSSPSAMGGSGLSTYITTQFGTVSLSGTIPSGGAGNAKVYLPPTRLITVYIRL